MNDCLTEKIVHKTRVFEGRIINLRVDEVTLPNGSTATREVVEHPGAVAVVPVRSDGSVIMVKQYRHPAAKIMLEIPAGKLDVNENPDICAVRELEEETGYKAGNIQKLAAVYTTPGFTNEIIHIYMATDLKETKQNTDEDEFIDIEYYSPIQLKELAKAGEIDDAKTLLGLFMAGVLS